MKAVAEKKKSRQKDLAKKKKEEFVKRCGGGAKCPTLAWM